MKHKEVAKAWLDGKTIEVCNSTYCAWREIDQEKDMNRMPFFHDDWNYRIKQNGNTPHKEETDDE